MLLLVIIVFKGEGSERVSCSVSRLLELASGKSQEFNCVKTQQVAYEVTRCCLQINRVCQDGVRFNWSSSNFHVNKNRTRIFDINLLVASVIVVSGNVQFF